MQVDHAQRADVPLVDKRCHCVKSRCLKLYCDCFGRGVYCSGCACVDCQNTEEHEQLVASKRAGIREKNPEAFQSSSRGCNCRRSQCLKMYCECYKHGIACSAGCKCQDCLNVTDGLMHRSKKAGATFPDRATQAAPSIERLPQPLSIAGAAALSDAAAAVAAAPAGPAAQPCELAPTATAAEPLESARSAPQAAPASAAAHVAPDPPRAATQPAAPTGALPLHESLLATAAHAAAPTWCGGAASDAPEPDVVTRKGTKRASPAVEPPQWGVSRARTMVRPPSATHAAQKARGLITLPADNSPMGSLPRYRPLSAGESALYGKQRPGDKTWLFGGVGQPSLRQVATSEPWPYAPSLHTRSLTSSEQHTTTNTTAAWPSSEPPSRQHSVPYEGQPPVVEAPMTRSRERAAAVPLLEAVPREWQVQGDGAADGEAAAGSALLPASISPLRRPIASPRGIELFTSPGRQPSKAADAAALATPSAQHLIFAPRETGGGDKAPGGERILSAGELLPLPMTASKGPASKRGVALLPSTWLKTPVKGMPASPFPAAEESPSERSTIPQLYTPEINAVLDLDVSIKWRHPSEAGMSPLPAVTPLVTSAEPAKAGLRGAPPQGAGAGPSGAAEMQRRPSLRSHRTLDFSEAQGGATLAQPAPLSTAWHLNDGGGSQGADALGDAHAAPAAQPASSLRHAPFSGLVPHAAVQQQPQQGPNMDALFKHVKPQNEQVLQAWHYIHSRVNGE